MLSISLLTCFSFFICRAIQRHSKIINSNQLLLNPFFSRFQGLVRLSAHVLNLAYLSIVSRGICLCLKKTFLILRTWFYHSQTSVDLLSFFFFSNRKNLSALLMIVSKSWSSIEFTVVFVTRCIVSRFLDTFHHQHSSNSINFIMKSALLFLVYLLFLNSFCSKFWLMGNIIEINYKEIT